MHTKGRLWVHVLAALVWGVAVLNIWSAIFPSMPERFRLLRQYLPLEVMHGSRLLTVAAGFLLLFLGHGLWRHKKRAWQAAVVVLCVSIALHLAKGLDWEEAAASTVVVAALIALRARFRAESDPPSLRRGVRVFALSVLSACVYGTIGFYFLDREFHARFGLTQSIQQTLRMFFAFGDVPVPHTKHARWFLGSVYLMGITTFTSGVVAALRPMIYRSTEWENERQHAEEILERHGRSSLARMTIFPDKTFYFPPGLEAYLSFRTIGNVAVVLGDPICPPHQAAAAIEAFALHCADMDWTPAYYQVLPDYIDHYRSQGYQVLRIGEEAVVDLRSFDLHGADRKELRNAVNRLTKSGYEARFYTPPIDEGLLDQLRLVSDEWLRHMHGREKRFSLGWFDPGYLRTCDIEVITAPNGRIEAFANFFTQFQVMVITPDLMRRRNDTPKRVMDFLFVQAMEHYRDLGFEGLNLGLSPLAGVGQDEGADVRERVVALLYEHFNRFYSFKGLHAYKEKFQPRWEPRYLVYASKPGVLKAALAVVRANNSGSL